MKTILLVDDEKRMLQLLTLYLTPLGYTCIPIDSGEEAVKIIKEKSIDLVLLDIMMPEQDGFETCSQIRSFSNIPIILLTALHSKEDIVKGLNLGADDYVSKPFDQDELVARIEAITRRIHSIKPTQIIVEELIWDEAAFELSYRGVLIPLTPKEFLLMGMFLKNPNKVLAREQLLLMVWGYDALTEDRTIDSHVRNLREKLRKSGFFIDDFLKTVWGVGYKWTQKK